MEIASMFGFVKNQRGIVVIANRIFETVLYNYFLTLSEMQNSVIYKTAIREKSRFIENEHLNMELVLEKFVSHFHDLYGDMSETFLEEGGRRYFPLYLRPIINGTGNYYIESITRNLRRTDVIVDYLGEQFIIEMKIWHGDEYNARGEAQLAEYLDYYHADKGYLLSFNFNKNKQIGVKKVTVGNRVLVEGGV